MIKQENAYDSIWNNWQNSNGVICAISEFHDKQHILYMFVHTMMEKEMPVTYIQKDV